MNHPEHTNKYDPHELRARVMRAIQEKSVRPVSRWRFVLSSLTFVVGALIVLILALYAASVAFFLLRESGLFAELSLGIRGWRAFAHAMPLPIFAVFIFLVAASMWAVRQYGFSYRRPGITTFVAVLLVACLGGYLLAQTTLHRRLAFAARHGGLPPIVGFWYREPFRVPQVPGAYAGTIMGVLPDGFIAVDGDDDRIVRVVVTPGTRVAPGFVIKTGQRIVAVGDVTADGVLHAFGIREIGPERE